MTSVSFALSVVPLICNINPAIAEADGTFTVDIRYAHHDRTNIMQNNCINIIIMSNGLLLCGSA